jgi:ATP-dependent helicase/nuclease subunit A
VRKRDAFVNALTRALKRRGNIPVAGADRLVLTSHIAVQDLAGARPLPASAGRRSFARGIDEEPAVRSGEDDIFAVAALRGEMRASGPSQKFAADGNPRLALRSVG